MGRVTDSRASQRAGEQLIAAKGNLRKVWEQARIGWTYDELMDYLRAMPGIPEEVRGKVLGAAATVGILTAHQVRDGDEQPEVGATSTFEVEVEERGVVPPHDGDRMWGTLNGSRYCVLMSRDPFPDGSTRWHISVSNEAHLNAGHDVPVWRDLVAIAHQLRPGVPFTVGIPPANMWMNSCPNVLHAVEVHDDGMVASWRAQAAAVEGTDAATPS